MASKYSPCVLDLTTSSKKDFLKAAGVLIKIAEKIEGNPGVEKYKSLKLSSRTFMESILPFEGAVQCLYEMGFVEDDDRFVHEDGRMENLRSVRMQLEDLVKEKKSHRSDDLTQNRPARHLLASESEVKQRLESNSTHVLIYEDRTLQEKARSVIPLKSLEEKANQRLSGRPEFSDRKIMDYKDCLILELLYWFKHDFFSWTNAPKCDLCQEKKTISIGMQQPNREEQKWGAGRVEGYKCPQCDRTIRFPRYNHPGKLLDTRTGRCGEWANCFSLLCRSLGFDTRHVVDWTDHVWTEVYSHAAKRWLHCDPCENACDKPLLYEQGWKKKLSLIVAFSCEEVVDVTWRYTADAEKVTERRGNMFRESWLRNTIHEMRSSKKMSFDKSTRERIDSRLVREMVELNSPKVTSGGKYGGRTTGSLQWRKARGELGEGAKEEHTIIPTAKELKTGVIDISYFSSLDKYVRGAKDQLPRWDSLVHKVQNIDRKVENDWNMAYLARTPSTSTGHISWKIDLCSESKQVIKVVKVAVNSTVFQSGVVKWCICTDKKSIPIEIGCENTLTQVAGAQALSLHAFLSGGDGDSAWQHTQLFRESLDSKGTLPQLKLVVMLTPKVD